MAKSTCKTYDAKFKAKVSLESIRASTELIKLSVAHNVPKTTIVVWKERLLNEASELFIPAHEKDKKIKQLTEKISVHDKKNTVIPAKVGNHPSKQSICQI